ncbi:MAG: trigger factor, partial [bacterium]
MQIERKDLDHQVEFRVIVPAERVENAIAKATNKLGKEALIPGFRKGKAPLQVIKAFVGKERIKDEALSTLLAETVDKVYEKEGVTPLFSPQLTVEQFEEGMPFVFRLIVDPWPEFDLPPVEQVKIDLPPPAVTEDDVNRTIYRLRESYATLIPKDGPAETGDLVTIKWRIGNEPYTTEMLELGKKNFLPEFDQ